MVKVYPSSTCRRAARPANESGEANPIASGSRWVAWAPRNRFQICITGMEQSGTWCSPGHQCVSWKEFEASLLTTFGQWATKASFSTGLAQLGTMTGTTLQVVVEPRALTAALSKTCGLRQLRAASPTGTGKVGL